MIKSLEDHFAEQPMERGLVEEHKQRMLAKVRGHRLRELREQLHMTQTQLAERTGISPRQISRIERGDLEEVRLRALRVYLETVGAELSVSAVLGDERIRVS